MIRRAVFQTRSCMHCLTDSRATCEGVSVLKCLDSRYLTPLSFKNLVSDPRQMAV
jgi:hypothetical protein